MSFCKIRKFILQKRKQQHALAHSMARWGANLDYHSRGTLRAVILRNCRSKANILKQTYQNSKLKKAYSYEWYNLSRGISRRSHGAPVISRFALR